MKCLHKFTIHYIVLILTNKLPPIAEPHKKKEWWFRNSGEILQYVRILEAYYHLAIKLLECNVFSRVCLTVEGLSDVTITNDAIGHHYRGPLALTPPPAPRHMEPHWKWIPWQPCLHPDMGPHWTGTTLPLLVTFGGHQWRLVQTCSLQDTLPPVLTSGIYWSTYSQCKWAVRVLLECFLDLV